MSDLPANIERHRSAPRHDVPAPLPPEPTRIPPKPTEEYRIGTVVFAYRRTPGGLTRRGLRMFTIQGALFWSDAYNDYVYPCVYHQYNQYEGSYYILARDIIGIQTTLPL